MGDRLATDLERAGGLDDNDPRISSLKDRIQTCLYISLASLAISLICNGAIFMVAMVEQHDIRNVADKNNQGLVCFLMRTEQAQKQFGNLDARARMFYNQEFRTLGGRRTDCPEVAE